MIVVTGAGSNIGRSIAHTFAREGTNVVIADVSEQDGRKVAGEVSDLGGGALFIRTDVTRPDEIEAMLKKALDEFEKIDILINNVGWDHLGLFLEKPREEWVREVDLNFWSVINCTRAVLVHMVKQKKGAIVNISSDAGRMGEYQEAVYSGCKGAVIALTKSLAREVGRYGIRLHGNIPHLPHIVLCSSRPWLTMQKLCQNRDLPQWHEDILVWLPHHFLPYTSLVLSYRRSWLPMRWSCMFLLERLFVHLPRCLRVRISLYWQSRPQPSIYLPWSRLF